jgi:DNA-binding MarR family transcriptional regulator
MADTPDPRVVAALDRALTQLTEIIESIYIERPLERVLGDAEEITAAQLRTLRQLSSVDHLTVGSIAEGLRISYPAATKAVDRLVERELASRHRDTGDARSIHVQLTDKGRAVVQHLALERREQLRNVLERIGGDQPAQALLRLLEVFIEESRR